MLFVYGGQISRRIPKKRTEASTNQIISILMAVFKACKQCGDRILVQPGLVDRKKFCSSDCMDTWWKGKRRSPQTEFGEGNRPQTWVPVGTESAATKGGYIKVKVAEPNVWRLRSHLVWEKTHGKPLPEGWIVRHLDGDPANDHPDNLRAMPRSKHLETTLQDPEVKKRKREATVRASKRRWKRWRRRKREESLRQYDSYYWE